MVDCARPCQLVCIDRSYSHTKSHFIMHHIFPEFSFHQASSEYFQLILFYVHQIPLWFLAASHQAVLLLPEMLPCSSTRRWFPNVCIKVHLHSFNSAPCFINGHSTGSILQLLQWLAIHVCAWHLIQAQVKLGDLV